jgi:hypothetical protein
MSPGFSVSLARRGVMKRALVLGFVGVLLVCAPGCSSNDPESLYKQMLADMNSLSDALQKKESPEKIKAAADKLKATSDKLEASKVTKEEKERIVKKYEKETTEAGMKFFAAMLSNPEGAKSIEGMGGLGGMGGGGRKPGAPEAPAKPE